METPAKAIERLRQEIGPDLSILAHHYQNDDIVRHADLTGDSLELARKIPALSARHVVFCGVFFMAETAAILANPGQKIHNPEPEAGCVMSEMAPEVVAKAVMDRLTTLGRRIVPLTYVNSSAGIKALVGAAGGAVCTSANAKKMLAWALTQGEAVLFLPDKNLAQNTADQLGLPPSERALLDIRAMGEKLDLTAAAKAKLLMWPGLCLIHHRFKTEHIASARQNAPGVKVVVHPECPPEVVAAADAAGSTSFIIRYVAEAPEGAVVAIGTEINLVRRLAKQYAGKKTIFPLIPSACLNMAKVTEAKLAALLADIEHAPATRVDPAMAASAKLALERMLAVS